MKYLSILIIFLVGCSQASQDVSPWQEAMRQGNSDLLSSTKAVESTTAEAIGILKENTAALSAIKTKVESLEGSLQETRQTVGTLEASLIVPKSESGKEVIKSALEPVPVVNASSGAGPGRLTSDGTRLKWNVEGDWNPDILTTARHLREDHGIDTNGMTHQQMADLHASIHEGKPVAMKSKPLQMVNLGGGCPGGVCPTPRRGLFGRRR